MWCRGGTRGKPKKIISLIPAAMMGSWKKAATTSGACTCGVR